MPPPAFLHKEFVSKRPLQDRRLHPLGLPRAEVGGSEGRMAGFWAWGVLGKAAMCAAVVFGLGRDFAIGTASSESCRL